MPSLPDAGLVVAIDGPSGSGKSSVARRVAHDLGLRYLDTGAMYRAVAWRALERNLDLADQAAVAALARAVDIDLTLDPDVPQRVLVDGVDATAAIREPRVDEAVSAVATNLEVRAELVRRQRQVADAGSVVLEGRDTTTVVAPWAPVRVLLTADPAARVSRRALQRHGTDDRAALEATHAAVITRDSRDATVVEFSEAADGVALLDSSHAALDEVVAEVLDMVAAARAT